MTASPPDSQRRGIWIIAVAITVGLGSVVLLDRDSLVGAAYFWDDEFYYFQVARNVAAGNGFTFDGVHETNGFQPLWLFLLVPIFGLVPGDLAPLRVVAMVEIALIVLAAVGVFRVLHRRIGEAPALAAALWIVAQPGATMVFRVGMETSLTLCLLVVVWRKWLALAGQGAVPTRRWLSLGLWCALAFLARLEVGLALPVLLFLARRRLRGDPAAVAALVAPAALCAAAYLAWNQLAFGTWLPISGMVKTRWAWVGGPWGLPEEHVLSLVRVPWVGDRLVQRLFGNPSESGAAAAIAGLLLALSVAAAWRCREHVREAVRRSGAAFVLLCGGLILLADKIVMRHMMVIWYEVPIFLATSVAAAALLYRTTRLARLAAFGALVACLARAPLALWHARDSAGHVIDYAIQAAGWLEGNTAADERIGTWRWGGVLAYFSHRKVTVLDGLPNNADFFRRVVVGGDVEGYLEDEGIRWLAGPGCGPNPPFAEVFPAVNVPETSRPRLSARFALAASFHGPRDGCPSYTLWRHRGGERVER